MKRLLSQFGFSLVQSMILASVIAGGSLIATKLLNDQKLAQKGTETRSRVDMLHDLIYSVLQHRQHCTETLLQLGNPPTPGSMTHIKSSNSSNLFSVFAAGGHVYMNQQVAIKSISYNPPHIDIAYERLDSSEKTRTKNGYGAKEINKSISLIIQTNPQDGSFLSCYGVKEGSAGNSNLAQTFCQSMPGLFQWDSSNNVCKLIDHTCPPGKIFIGIIGSDGKPQCNSIGEQMNLSEIISPPEECNPDYASNVRFILEGNKVSIKCCDIQTSCDIIRASVCNNQHAGKDSCGHDCGMGVRDPGTSCEDKRANTCAGTPAGVNNCGQDCGMGEKNCTCTPTTPCLVLIEGACTSVDVTDSCGNSCGKGQKNCDGCTPIDGGWSSWSSWSPCNFMTNTQTRSRACNNPTPNSCGASCSGATLENKACDCTPVHGGWSDWGPWSECKDGSRVRLRTCDNPKANSCGVSCKGTNIETASCAPKKYCYWEARTTCPALGASNIMQLNECQSASDCCNSASVGDSNAPYGTDPRSTSQCDFTQLGEVEDFGTGGICQNFTDWSFLGCKE